MNKIIRSKFAIRDATSSPSNFHVQTNLINVNELPEDERTIREKTRVTHFSLGWGVRGSKL